MRMFISDMHYPMRCLPKPDSDIPLPPYKEIRVTATAAGKIPGMRERIPQATLALVLSRIDGSGYDMFGLARRMLYRLDTLQYQLSVSGVEALGLP